jgi:hypothetical protein
LLSQNRPRLDGLAEALFHAETLEGPAAYAAAGLEPPNDDATPPPKRGRVAVEPPELSARAAARLGRRDGEAGGYSG